MVLSSIKDEQEEKDKWEHDKRQADKQTVREAARIFNNSPRQ
jgi:hypothetical protein